MSGIEGMELDPEKVLGTLQGSWEHLQNTQTAIEVTHKANRDAKVDYSKDLVDIMAMINEADISDIEKLAWESALPKESDVTLTANLSSDVTYSVANSIYRLSKIDSALRESETPIFFPRVWPVYASDIFLAARDGVKRHSPGEVSIKAAELIKPLDEAVEERDKLIIATPSLLPAILDSDGLQDYPEELVVRVNSEHRKEYKPYLIGREVVSAFMSTLDPEEELPRISCASSKEFRDKVPILGEAYKQHREGTLESLARDLVRKIIKSPEAYDTAKDKAKSLAVGSYEENILGITPEDVLKAAKRQISDAQKGLREATRKTT